MSTSILTLENYHLFSKYKGRILAAEDLSKPSPNSKGSSGSRYLDIMRESKEYERPIRRFKLGERRIKIPSIEEIEAELRQDRCTSGVLKQSKDEVYDKPVLSTRNIKLNKKLAHEFKSFQLRKMNTNHNKEALFKNCASQTIEDSAVKEVKVQMMPEANLKGTQNYNRLLITVNDAKENTPIKDEDIKESAKTKTSTINKTESKSKLSLEAQNSRDSRNTERKNKNSIRAHTKDKKKANTYRILNTKPKQLLKKTLITKKEIKKSDATKQFTFNSLWEIVKEHSNKCAEFKVLLINKGFL